MARKRWQAAVVVAVALVSGGLGAASAGASTVTEPATVAGSVQALPAIAAGQVTGGPLDISCPTSTWCAAVGTLNDNGDAEPGGTDTGATVAAAWVLAGGSWHVSDLPVPSDVSSGSFPQLSGISCAAAGHCVVIATYITTAKSDNVAVEADTLSGGAWHMTTVPLPRRIFPVPLSVGSGSDVSCPTVTSCVAVASTLGGGKGAGRDAAAYRLSAGRWTARLLPTPKDSEQPVLDGVSCASASWCTAVGQQFSSTSSDDAALVETLRGTAWTASTVGGAKATTTALHSISCPAAGSCLAVGDRTPSDGANQPIVARLSHGHWTARAFTPKNIDLAGISCATTASCTAVGSKQQRGNRTDPVLAKWSHGRWAVHEPAGRAALEEVSCPTASRCWSTVGYDAHDRVAAINGWHFATTPLPLPAGPPVAALAAVSCATKSRCLAVGGYSAASGDHDLVETENATGHWEATTGLKVSGADAGLYGVSCAPGSRNGTGCVAVGNNVVAVLSSGRWRARLLPVPAGSRDLFLNGVSCPAVRRCVAVGSIQPSRSADDVALVATLTGTKWKVTLLPTPSGATYSDLAGVSCPSVGNCMAVGTTSSFPDESSGLSEQLKHGTWTAGSPGGYPDAVACPRTTSWCVVAADGVVDRWNGSVWSSRNVVHDGEASATAVACPSARFCVVAGDDGSQATGLWVLTVSPTHVSVRHPVSPPAGTTAAGLSGIACPNTRCVVVGGDFTSAGSYALAGTVTPSA